MGVRAARERLAATLGNAGDTGNARDTGDPPGAGSTGVSVFPGDSADAVRELSGSLDSLGLLELQLTGPGFVGHRRAGGQPLSARVRGRTGVRAAALLGVLAAVVGGCFWWQAGAGGAQMFPLSGGAPAAGEAPGTPGAPGPVTGTTTVPPESDASPSTGSITVHVAGAVARPGVVQLPAGSRLHEAIAAAGGATAAADPDLLNLAAVLEDGQKVLVPVRGEPAPTGQPGGVGTPPPASGSGGARPGGGTGKINLNTAGVEELGTLPRVGPVLAQRIVDWRQQHGLFKRVQELDAVDGIGPKLLDALLPLVSI